MTGVTSVPLPDPKPGHHWEAAGQPPKPEDDWLAVEFAMPGGCGRGMTFIEVPDSMWTDEQVEAAARVIFAEARGPLSWDRVRHEAQPGWVAVARAALDAATKAGA